MPKKPRKKSEPSIKQKLVKELRAKVKAAKASLRKHERDLRSLTGRRKKSVPRYLQGAPARIVPGGVILEA